MDIRVRKTHESDWEDLKDIRLASLKEAPRSFGSSFAKAATIPDKEWQDRAGNRMALTYFIAYLNTVSAGLIGGVAHEGEYHLISMWVRPAHRRKGVAEQLIEAVFRQAKEEGFAEVVLSVSPENKAARKLYEKLGFVFVDHYERLESYPEIVVQKMIAKLDQGG